MELSYPNPSNGGVSSMLHPLSTIDHNISTVHHQRSQGIVGFPSTTQEEWIALLTAKNVVAGQSIASVPQVESRTARGRSRATAISFHGIDDFRKHLEAPQPLRHLMTPLTTACLESPAPSPTIEPMDYQMEVEDLKAEESPIARWSQNSPPPLMVSFTQAQRRKREETPEEEAECVNKRCRFSFE